MATVTALTAERMLEIEAESIVDGSIDGAGHLILTRHDGTTIDAGSVQGPQGIQGVMGPNPDNTAVWQDYVPVTSNLGGMTMTFGAHPDNHARYLVRGKICFVSISRLFTFAGTMQQFFEMSMPLPKGSPGTDALSGDAQNALARTLAQSSGNFWVGNPGSFPAWTANTYHIRINGFYQIA